MSAALTTKAIVADEAGVTARRTVNHLGHSKISMAQDRYLGHGVTDRRAAEVLGEGTSRL